jgi:hypothetical protein
MEYRGVKYSVVQGALPNVWKWRVLVGRPELLRMGEAETRTMAEKQVHAIIDRAIELDNALQAYRDKKPHSSI